MTREALVQTLRDAYRAARVAGIAKADLPTRDDVINACIYELDILIQRVWQQIADVQSAVAAAAEQAARAERGAVINKLSAAIKNAVRSGVERSALPTFEQIKESSVAELNAILVTVNQMTLYTLEDSLFG